MNLPKEPTVTGLLNRGYRAITTAVAPLAAPVLLTSRRGRIRLGERFGAWGDVGKVDWWFHGASVGEVQGLLPLMRRVKEQGASLRILLTCTSPTGLERGRDVADELRLLPLDAPWCVRRALRHCSPGRFVLCETELWPVLLDELFLRGVTCDLVNGRISDYTVRRYRKLASLFTPLLARMHRICVPSAEQADRFIELGAHAASVAVTGHTKYDTSPSVTTEEAKRAIREEFFPGDRGDAPIIVLGSVRPGEEEWWLQAFERKNAHGTPAKMIIAPRHAEKFDYFAERLARSAVTWERWSRQSRETREIVLLDAMGQLERAYSIASLAFIGATFVDIGGHNPFEPAMYGVPVCVGPFVRNIRDLVSDMEAAAGIVRLATSVDVEVAVSRVVNGDPELAHLGEKGRDVWKRHSGAAHRVISELVGENL